MLFLLTLALSTNEVDTICECANQYQVYNETQISMSNFWITNQYDDRTSPCFGTCRFLLDSGDPRRGIGNYVRRAWENTTTGKINIYNADKYWNKYEPVTLGIDSSVSASKAFSTGQFVIVEVLTNGSGAVIATMGVGSPAFSPTHCPADYHFFKATRKCYNVFENLVTFSSAEEQCKKDGGFLVSIAKEEENSFIQTLVSWGQAWIGLNNATGNFSWPDGTPVTYTNWRTGEPQKDCGLIDHDSGKWLSLSCSTTQKYICSKGANRCDTGWKYFSGNCYCPFQAAKNLSAIEAEADCISYNAHLTSIHSREENNFIYALGADTGFNETYIGLYRNDTGWTNFDGTHVNYGAWCGKRTSNPPDFNKNCTHMYYDKSFCCMSLWGDHSCDEERSSHYTCKKPAYY